MSIYDDDRYTSTLKFRLVLRENWGEKEKVLQQQFIDYDNHIFWFDIEMETE